MKFRRKISAEPKVRLHLPLTWAVTLGFTVATLVGILILTRDLGTSEAIFRDGVVQANKVNDTTDRALGGAEELPPANAAINAGMPEVVGVIASLNTANGTLSTLGEQLQSLGAALDEADPALVNIIGSAELASKQAKGAAGPAGHIAFTLDGANQKVGTLAGLLDETQTLSDTIDSKLRIALVLPKIPE